MPEKSNLQILECECTTVNDWIELSQQALEEPAYKDYAVELVHTAKSFCETLEDYLEIAQFVAANLLTDSVHLKDWLEQAEDLCYAPMEFAELGNAFTMIGHSDLGLALIYRAVEVSDIQYGDGSGCDLSRLADYAWETDNKELAEVLEMERSYGSSLDATELQHLANWVRSSNVEVAKFVARRAERHLNTIHDTVAHAELIVQWFSDEDQAHKLLENAATDCKDFEDYIELARGLTEVHGEPERIDYLLEEAVQFAMVGEDFAHLAYAWLELKNDRGAAHAIFRQAVPDIFNRTILQNIATTAIREFNNPDLALQCYQKTTELITNPNDLVKLTVEGWETLGDEWVYYTRQLVDTVKPKLASALDLIALAESVVQTLNDRDMVCAIYRDAVTASDSFSELERILASQRATLNDAELTLETLDRMKFLTTDSS